MTYFPQPHPANRQRLLKVGGSVVVAIRSEGAGVIRAKLHELSATGGLLLLSKAFEQGDFVSECSDPGVFAGLLWRLWRFCSVSPERDAYALDVRVDFREPKRWDCQLPADRDTQRDR